MDRKHIEAAIAEYVEQECEKSDTAQEYHAKRMQQQADESASEAKASVIIMIIIATFIAVAGAVGLLLYGLLDSLLFCPILGGHDCPADTAESIRRIGEWFRGER